MIEWYRLDYGVGEMQHDVDRLLRVACAELRSFPPTRSITYRRRYGKPAASTAGMPRRPRFAPRWPRAASSPRTPTAGIAMPGSIS